jgi:exopolyphosphatase/guanosine-5'-triphosphate,3'-diphosphate pyrophosphatase
MIKIKKYAAIDIGSNAMRLLIVNIVEQEGKHSLIKVRCWCSHSFGSRCFTVGEISDENLDRMCDAMKAFNL